MPSALKVWENQLILQNCCCWHETGRHQARILLCLCSHAAEIKKQREFYQKLGMEVPGDIKGDLCNMKTHLDQRNGTLHLTCPTSDARSSPTFPEFGLNPSGLVLN